MDMNQIDMKKLASMMDNMKGKSEDELIRELVKMIKSGQSGVSSGKVMQMIQAMSPMLDAQQRKKLEKLVRELRS